MLMNLFVVLTFCLLGLTTTFAESAANNCPAGWISLHRGCYKFVDRDTKSWEDAAQVCSSEGGELTSIQSTKEKNEIDTYLRRQHPLQKKWWVGFERKENSGTNWMWIADGQPLNNQLIRWKRKGTIARRGKVCGMLENSNGLTVSNSRCSKREPFICEFHFIASRSETTTATTTSATTAAITTREEDFTTTTTTTDTTPKPKSIPEKITTEGMSKVKTQPPLIQINIDKNKPSKQSNNNDNIKYTSRSSSQATGENTNSFSTVSPPTDPSTAP